MSAITMSIWRGDVRHVALEEKSGSEMYLPIRQCPDVVVRSALPLPVLSERVEAALRPPIPSLPKGSMPRPGTAWFGKAGLGRARLWCG